MKRIITAVLALSSVALAANEPRQRAVDAFLSRRDVKPLVDPRGLSSAGRAAFTGGFASSIEPRYGVPTFFWAAPRTGERTYREMGLSAAQAARRYLLTHAELYRGEPSRWAEAQISSLHELGDGTAVIVSFQQRLGGVRVFRDEVKVIMNSKLELIALSGYLTPATRPLGTFALAPATAIASAFQKLTGRSLTGPELQSLGVGEGGYESWRLEGAQTPVRSRAVYFPLPEGVVPGFYVELDVPTSENDSSYFSFVVSAIDGEILFEKNLTAADAYTYKVWADTTAPFLPFDGPQGLGATPHPAGTPNGFDPGNVTQNLVTLEHAGLSTLDPWLAPAATTTSGNNVRAYADITRSNGFTMATDPIGTATSTNTFEYTYDFMVGPEANLAQRQSAIVQLFYDNNLFHDWFYDDGFNEAAGNAQVNNRGRGGIGNDVLLAEAQDYSGRSNANMSTPSDGASPRMQMFVFDGDSGLSLTANTTTPQTFNTLGADYGAQVFNVTAPLLLANDGSTTPTGTATSGTTSDACQALPAGFATGKVLLVDRGGGCTFVSKAEAAQAAGALGVIIANNMSGGPISLSGPSPSTTIPVLSVSQNSGNTLKGIITNGGGNTTVTLNRTPSTDRDGTLDNGVVAHEWGHFISNRLIGDGNGLSSQQSAGMGEGWSDFNAALMIAREADAQVPSNANWNGAFGLAGWAGFTTDPNAYYYGFRRYPLSADFAKNPLTFKHISDAVALPATPVPAFGGGPENSQVHNTGEVWAAMLWECYVALLRDTRRTFPQSQALMKRYLVAAFKATPFMPTFVEARDAVLAVAVANDQTDFASLWAAFARRGIGMGAVAPDRDSQDNTPVTESFTVGNAVTITEVSLNDSTMNCDNDGNLDANETGVLTIRLRNTGVGTLSTAQVAVTSTTQGVSFPQGASTAMPSTAPFGVATVSFAVAMADIAGSQGGMFNITITDSSLAMGPITHQAMFRLNYDMVPMSSRLDDVESPMTTWASSSDPDLNTGSNFRIFQSSATQHFWFGPNPASPADTYLTSPPLIVGAGPVVISFKHRFDFERSSTEFFDGAVIEVTNDDGRSWTDVGMSSTPGYTGTLTTSQNQSANPLMGQRAFVGKSVGYPTFNTETVDLGTRFANQTIRLRFRIGADDAAAAKGWELDDVLITGITNKPFTSVTSDPNMCTNGAPTATIGPNVEVNERESITLVGGGTDPDGDTVTVSWTQLTGPTVALSGATFTAPNVDVDTPITLQMTVTDGRAVTMPLEQTVLVKNVNRRPVATVPATMEVMMGDIVTVLGSGADEDGEPITYEWSQVSGPTVQLTGATSDDVVFTAPQLAASSASEVVKLQLVVRDLTEASDPAVVDVVVKNPNPIIEEPKPKGCGCTTGFELLPLAALGLMFRSRRRERS